MSNSLFRNPNYHALIRSQEGLEVKAHIPEQIFLATGSEWEPRMPSTLSSLLSGVGGKLGTLARGSSNLNNFDIVVQSLTMQSWRSSAPIQFNLTLLFNAYEDAVKDVVEPMAKLQALSLPYNSEVNPDLLLPPGPSPRKPDQARISMRLGRFLYIHSVILLSVNNTFDTILDKNGQPLSGQAELSLVTVNTPSRKDVTTFYVAMNNGNINDVYGVRNGYIGAR